MWTWGCPGLTGTHMGLQLPQGRGVSVAMGGCSWGGLPRSWGCLWGGGAHGVPLYTGLHQWVSLREGAQGMGCQ